MACMTIMVAGCNGNLSSDSNHYVKVDTTSTLYIFYPSYKSIDFVCGERPSSADTSIVFCCGAAFTKNRRLTTNHDHIGGIHTSQGIVYQGYECPDNNGCFVFYDGKWNFSTDSISNYMAIASKKRGMGFSQIMILPESSSFDKSAPDIFRLWGVRCYKDREGKTKIRRTKHKYRALCEKNGQICIAELKETGTFQEFVHSLKSEKIEKAIYLDTGIGWGYCWYRVTNNRVKTLHPYVHPFVSNWLVFKK